MPPSRLRQNVSENMAHVECSIADVEASVPPAASDCSVAASNEATQAVLLLQDSCGPVQHDRLLPADTVGPHFMAAMAGRATLVEPRQPPVRAPGATRVALPAVHPCGFPVQAPKQASGCWAGPHSLPHPRAQAGPLAVRDIGDGHQPGTGAAVLALADASPVRSDANHWIAATSPASVPDCGRPLGRLKALRFATPPLRGADGLDPALTGRRPVCT
jgi:hypothetical protein